MRDREGRGREKRQREIKINEKRDCKYNCSYLDRAFSNNNMCESDRIETFLWCTILCLNEVFNIFIRSV